MFWILKPTLRPCSFRNRQPSSQCLLSYFPSWLYWYLEWAISLCSLNLYFISLENRALQVLLGPWLHCRHWQSVKHAELEGNCFTCKELETRLEGSSVIGRVPYLSVISAFFSLHLSVLWQCENLGDLQCLLKLKLNKCPLPMPIPHHHLEPWRPCGTDNWTPHTYFFIEVSCCQVWARWRISSYLRTLGCFWSSSSGPHGFQILFIYLFIF